MFWIWLAQTTMTFRTDTDHERNHLSYHLLIITITMTNHVTPSTKDHSHARLWLEFAQRKNVKLFWPSKTSFCLLCERNRLQNLATRWESRWVAVNRRPRRRAMACLATYIRRSEVLIFARHEMSRIQEGEDLKKPFRTEYTKFFSRKSQFDDQQYKQNYQNN